MEASFNLWSVLFSTATAQGFFLSVLIFLRKSRVNNLLGLTILTFSLLMFSYILFWTGYGNQLPRVLSVFIGATYSLGPLLYFYIKSTKRESPVQMVHFLPQVAFLVYFFSIGDAMPRWVFIAQPAIQCLHIVVYTVLMFRVVYQDRNYVNGGLKLFVWRRKVAYAFAGYVLMFLTYYILVWTGLLKIEYDYAISLAACFFIYFIGYHGFAHQEVLAMYEASRYAKSSLTASAASSILTAVERHMTEQEPWRNGTVRLGDLAETLGLTPHQLSQTINELTGSNFTEYVNRFRIAEAKKLLRETDYKVIQVAYDAGFNNKVTFNKAFRKATGLAPSAYRTAQGKSYPVEG